VATGNYFALLKAEIGRLLHDLCNAASIPVSNLRFLEEANIPGLTQDQRDALHESAVSAERTAALVRELQGILG
jgi:hypothetical protein